jgi:Asp-tRNA(Asn)/Glu-tRNA(Gln) amidotransferase A subunit family amidase
LPDSLLDLCLARIRDLDGEVRAWVEVAPQPPLGDGPLNGLPFGAKDIFETRGLGTAYGSPLYAGRKGDCDAAALTHLRRRGAILLGKTHTTAFASFDPAPTCNPRVPGHTPGGSSAGSAAAVAAGMVPLALGTQTLGSVLRPASYCGVCGFKPTFGRIPMDGVLPFAPSLDTAGLFTATAGEMARIWAASFGAPAQAELRRAAWIRVPPEKPIQEAVERLRATGVRVDALDPPEGWRELIGAAFEINCYEGARTHEARYRAFGERMGARLAELIREGLFMPRERYQSAVAHVAAMRSRLEPLFTEYDVLLSPAATGPAPAGYASTGDPSNNAPWTALGVPAIGVPLPGQAPPMGLQITAATGDDDRLVLTAKQIEELL